MINATICAALVYTGCIHGNEYIQAAMFATAAFNLSLSSGE